MKPPRKPVDVYSTVPRKWPDSTIVCIASGPSLTKDDVNYVRGKADAVIVINNNYQLAPWADCLYAADGRWFDWHKGVPSFTGLKFSLSKHGGRWKDVQVLRNAGAKGLSTDPSAICNGRNSGYQAINLAVHFGARRVILLGYDMQQGPNREEHWHKEHPNRSRSPYDVFLRHFNALEEPLKALGIEVINCTRRTALTIFPCQPLDVALRVSLQVAS